MKFTIFETRHKAEDKSSEFSRFIRDASSGEKKRVFMDVARKASADQLKIMRG
jgi:hypothetical protein